MSNDAARKAAKTLIQKIGADRLFAGAAVDITATIQQAVDASSKCETCGDTGETVLLVEDDVDDVLGESITTEYREACPDCELGRVKQENAELRAEVEHLEEKIIKIMKVLKEINHTSNEGATVELTEGLLKC